MKVKFQADADLNEDIVKGVLRRVPEIDFQTATEATFGGVKDEDVLKITSSQKRILVSHDRKTMPKHFADFIQENKSYGVFIIPQKPEIISQIIEDLILIWSVTDAEEYIDSIRTLPL